MCRDQDGQPLRVGLQRMKVFRGGLSGRYFAAMMRWNGTQWEAVGGKHDVTEDVQYLIEDERKHGDHE